MKLSPKQSRVIVHIIWHFLEHWFSKTKDFPIKISDVYVQKIFLGDWFAAVCLGFEPVIEIY